MDPHLLQDYLRIASKSRPSAVAVDFGSQALTYSELDSLSSKMAACLARKGVGEGDRVAIHAAKTPAAIVGIFGILKAGSTYVPLDTAAPPARLARLVDEGEATSLITDARGLEAVGTALDGNSPLRTAVLLEPGAPPRGPLRQKLELVEWSEVLLGPPGQDSEASARDTAPAYILFTSGSTGAPKGVVISHRASMAFVEWAADCVGLAPSDVVTCPSPIHFDLSVFDVFASCRAGATMAPVPEKYLPFPVRVAETIDLKKTTVWYSVPSVLTMLLAYGNLRARDLSSLRTVIFAGEVFPVKHLRDLMSRMAGVRFMNWYGPTETNVCTWYEVPHLEAERTAPVPIGRPCPYAEAFLQGEDGKLVSESGREGELIVTGGSLMQGYWRRSEETSRALVPNPFDPESGRLAYRTGDMASFDEHGDLVYHGRRDGMVKSRGFRLELGEVEAALSAHPAVREAAVVPFPDDLVGNRLHAVVVLLEGASVSREELLAFVGKALPHYMVPETAEFRGSLPRTSAGKVDRVSLSNAQGGRR